MKEDLEKLVNKLNNILLLLLLALPLSAQVDSTQISISDSVDMVVDTLPKQAPLPVIEYTMQRKTYEIADILLLSFA